jgi:hypothetical protein
MVDQHFTAYHIPKIITITIFFNDFKLSKKYISIKTLIFSEKYVFTHKSIIS